jgi:hypothetical protein
VRVSLLVGILVMGAADPALAQRDSSKQPMIFQMAGSGGNCNGCGWTAAQGEIVEDTPAAFDAFLKIPGNDPQGHIVFHSPGGNLGAALKLGAMIRRMGLSTSIAQTVADGSISSREKRQIPGICVSACAYAFLGGKTRFASEGYGVHQFFSARKLTEQLESNRDPLRNGSDEQAIVGLLTLYVKSMGVDTDLVFVASSTAAADVYWLSKSELKRFRVDNSADSQEPWKTEPYRDGAVAVSSVQRGSNEPLHLTMFCRKAQSQIPFMMLSKRLFRGQPGWTPDSMTPQELRDSVVFLSISFNQRASGNNRSKGDISNATIGRDGTAYVTFKLTPADLANFLTARDAYIIVDQATVFGFPFYGDISLQDASAHINLAMRNCIGEQ